MLQQHHTTAANVLRRPFPCVGFRGCDDGGVTAHVGADSGEVWYFAYGSNMSPAIFLERRGMR
ncbi:MAG: hypothetical protein ACRD2A_23975, partial [Vicinamibacterales bacterium]